MPTARSPTRRTRASSGRIEFTYTARDVDPTRGSNVVTVSLTVNKLVYGFVNVQNLPPPANKTFKRGSTVGLKWQFTVGGVVVNSSNADVSITITDSQRVVDSRSRHRNPVTTSSSRPRRRTAGRGSSTGRP